jgi:rRNA maturation protein Rpf1
MTIIITTSREPSRRTRSFLKDLVATIPGSVKLNRGKATYDDLKNRLIRENADGLLMILEKKANPSALVYYNIMEEELRRIFLMKITSVRLARETKDYQKPLGIRDIIINPEKVPNGLPTEVSDALITALKPKIVIGTIANPRTIEIIVSGDNNEAIINFICTGTGRPCGPSFKAIKVIRYY